MPPAHPVIRPFLALAAGALLMLAGCSSTPPTPAGAPAAKPAAAKPAPAHEPVVIEVDRRGGNCHVRLDGYLDEYAARSLRQVMTELEKTSCRSKRVLLELDGGLVGSALTVGAIVKNRGYDTQVRPGTTCLTPCLLVFAAGRERILLPSVPPTRIGFSQIPPDEDFGRRVCESELTSTQALTLTRYLRAMLPLATASAVMRKLVGATCDRTEYLGPAEALEMGLATTTR